MYAYKMPPKRVFRDRFKGSDALFEACWRQYRQYLNGAIDDPTCDDDVMGWLESIASERVNSSSSRFYLYG